MWFFEFEIEGMSVGVSGLNPFPVGLHCEAYREDKLYSQDVGDDSDGPAVHSLTVGLLSQDLWS